MKTFNEKDYEGDENFQLKEGAESKWKIFWNILKYFLYGMLLWVAFGITVYILCPTENEAITIPLLLWLAVMIIPTIFFPKMVIRGAYLVWLNNNIKADIQQYPYTLRSFFILTELEAEAEKIMHR